MNDIINSVRYCVLKCVLDPREKEDFVLKVNCFIFLP